MRSRTSVDDSVHFVRDGREVRELGSFLPDDAGRFTNTLTPASLERIRRLIEIAVALERPMPTQALIEGAGATTDPKGALGALRMLDVEGCVHATSGGRKQLIWNPGPRPLGVEAPRAAWLRPTIILRELLVFLSSDWLSTDFIVRQCGFDPTLPPQVVEELLYQRTYAGLPVNVFSDASKNGRRYALGALKVLFWREQVAWRQYSRQAIEWQWIGEGGLERPFEDWRGRATLYRRLPDPYIDEVACDRADAREQRAAQRMNHFARKRHEWIEEHNPEAAAQYRFRQAQRLARLEARRRAVEREARHWGGPTQH
jgi:hypothetical protein